MSTPRPIEYSALNWVKSEIDETLKQARRALEAYVENLQDATQLRFCVAYLHQVHGTLRMIELGGAALLAEEMEQLARGLLKDEIARKQDAYEALMCAILQLPDYLEHVQGAQQDAPALVLPLLNNLRELRGEAHLPPGTWQSVQPPPAVTAPRAQVAPADMLDIRMRARKLRTAYQRALVDLYRAPPEGRGESAQKLAEALNELERATGQEGARQLWWVTGGLVEALVDKGLELDKAIKSLLGQTDREIKRLADEGEQSFAEGAPADLIKELLYYVSRATSSGARVSELRQAFNLHALLPQESMAAEPVLSLQPEALRSASAVLLEDLERIKEDLDIFVRSEQRNVASLQPLTDSLRQAADILNILGLSAQASLVREQLAMIEDALQGKLTLDDERHMHIAVTLLRVGTAVDGVSSQPFLQQEGAEPAAFFSEEGYRQLLNVVVRESKADLTRVKEAITGFAANTTQHELLASVPQWIVLVVGGLTMLQLERAAELLGACGHYIAQYFVAQKLVPDKTTLETLADLITAIEYYLEGVAENREDREAALDLAQASLRDLQQPTGAPTAAPPVTHTFEQSAVEAAPHQPAASALGVEGVPLLAAAPVTTQVATASTPVASPAAEYAPPQEVDSEIIEVFIEEVQEEIASIGQHLPLWQAKPEDQDLLRTVRRSFHTLKGSSRLVGARDLGEFAWSLENMLNRVIDGTIQAWPEVFALVEQSRALLPQLLAQFQGEPAPSGDVAGVIQSAQRLSQGQALAAVQEIPPVVAAPEPVPRARAALSEPEQPAVLAATAVSFDEAEEVGQAGPQQEVIEIESIPELASWAQIRKPIVELDSRLLEIFSNEVGDNLQVIERFIKQCRTQGGNGRVSKLLMHTLHTLRGSASMADVSEITELSAALERYAKRLNISATAVAGLALEVFEEGVRHIREMVEALQSGTTLRAASALISRINALYEESFRAVPPVQPMGPTAPKAETSQPVLQEANKELLDLFLEEAQEILEASEVSLQRWIRQGDKGLLEELQRQMHTLKGSARLAGVSAIGDLTHSLESLMTVIVEERMPIPVRLPEVMQQTQDRLLQMLDQLHANLPVQPAAELIADIEDFLEQRPEGPSDSTLRPQTPAALSESTALTGVLPAAAALPAMESDALMAAESNQEVVLAGERRGASRAQYEQVRVHADLVDSLVNLAAEVSISRSRIEQQVGAYKFNLSEMERTVTRLRDLLRRLEMETEGQIASRRAEAAARGMEEFDPLELDRFTHMQQLSRSLMESVNDITNLQASLHGITREAETLLLQQARVNTDLQEGLMRTRMVQFSRILPRLRRVVRQTARELGKQVELNVAGVEGEMDRAILDRVAPSLEHMLRNAVDHGIEAAPARRAAGKAEVGAILLEFTREGSEIVITVRDDGAGVNLRAVRHKAEERGLLKPNASVSDQELLQFILESGFSTAKEVTQISGRGVGMDVVNNQVKQLGGALQISSSSGQGTTFVIRLPFTLSVNHALLVQAGEDIYALPLTSVERVMRVSHEELEPLYANANPQCTLDGQIYQLVYLGALLCATHSNALPPLPGKGKCTPVLLARSGGYGMAMQVDSLLGSCEIVVKSLGPQISSVKSVAGATILGDGRVVLILDVPGLIRMGAGIAVSALEAVQAAAQFEAPTSRPPIVLVVDDSITVRKVTSRLLERHEMQVLTAKDGMDALIVMQQQIPDIMLLDIEMPRMDGYELATQMRNDARLRHIPIIMITSRSGEKHRARATQIGVNRYLGKPYKETELVESIKSLLQEQRTALH